MLTLAQFSTEVDLALVIVIPIAPPITPYRVSPFRTIDPLVVGFQVDKAYCLQVTRDIVLLPLMTTFANEISAWSRVTRCVTSEWLTDPFHLKLEKEGVPRVAFI
jgi:hypothetical protein